MSEPWVPVVLAVVAGIFSGGGIAAWLAARNERHRDDTAAIDHAWERLNARAAALEGRVDADLERCRADNEALRIDLQQTRNELGTVRAALIRTQGELATVRRQMAEMMESGRA